MPSVHQEDSKLEQLKFKWFEASVPGQSDLGQVSQIPRTLRFIPSAWSWHRVHSWFGVGLAFGGDVGAVMFLQRRHHSRAQIL